MKLIAEASKMAAKTYCSKGKKSYGICNRKHSRGFSYKLVFHWLTKESSFHQGLKTPIYSIIQLRERLVYVYPCLSNVV